MGQLTTVLLFIELLQKNTRNLDQKVNQRQNTICLEQKNYASPENFTPTLLVMLETFRMSEYMSQQKVTLSAPSMCSTCYNHYN